MPTYQYHCKNCGAELEVFQHFSDPSLTVCPECEGELRKVFNAVGIVFKGSGFYKTDSRGGSSIPAGKSNETTQPSAPAKESTAPTKKESSPTASTAAPKAAAS